MVAELDPAELSLMFIVVWIPNIIISLLLAPSLAGVCPGLHVSYVINHEHDRVRATPRAHCAPARVSPMFPGQCATNTDNLQLLIAPAPARMLGWGQGQGQVENCNPATGPLSQILVNLDFPGPESLEMTLTIPEFHQITYLFIPKCKRGPQATLRPKYTAVCNTPD